VIATPRTAAKEDAGLEAPPANRAALAKFRMQCGHDLCVVCASKYLTLAVPRSIRASRATAIAGIKVLCPGIHIAGSDDDAAFDLRCLSTLPIQLLAPFAPPRLLRENAASLRSGGSVSEERGGQLTTTVRSAAYIMLRCKPCPHCGAPSERVEGCRYVECGSCTREWCYECGGKDPETCKCVSICAIRHDLELLLAAVHRWLANTHWLRLVFALTLGLPLYLLFSVVWCIPYSIISVVAADAIVAAEDEPQDFLGCLPHIVACARTAVTRCSMASPSTQSRYILPASEWRQPGSMLCKLVSMAVTAVVCVTVVPLVIALWLGVAPLRYICALLSP
jgi:hypothetical protein